MFFSPVVALALSVLLAAADAVQLNVTMSVQAHDAIAIVVQVLVGIGVLPVTRSQIVSKVPLHVLTVITAVFGAIQVLQFSSLHVSALAHTVIAVALVIANGLGLTVASVVASSGVRGAALGTRAVV